MFGVPYHFLVIHFALVLAILALFYDLRGLYDLGYRFTLGAAASGLIAVATGLMLAGGGLSQMPVHAGTAIVGALALVALAMLRYSRSAREEEALSAFPATWLILEVLGGLGIVIAAFTGHRALIGL
jgi:hypothetical protein